MGLPQKSSAGFSTVQKAVLTIWLAAMLIVSLILAAVVLVGNPPAISAAQGPAAALIESEPTVQASSTPAQAATSTPPEPTATVAVATLTPGTHTLFEPTSTLPPGITPSPTGFITAVPLFEGPIVIGESAAGRPIEAFRFGNGPIKRLIIAGIHGGYEWNTTLLMTELMNYLQHNPAAIPHLISLYIVPTMNPDGLAREQGVNGRANDNNVDLNRNFPINWEAQWSRSGCWRLLNLNGGSGPGSEPETQAIMEFILDLRPSAIISYHSAALGIFPGGEPADPASSRLAETLAGVSSYPYPPVDTGCIYSGTLPDFAVANGIPAVDLELHTHTSTDFEENLKILQAFLEWRP
jgi:hypothetical protein